MMRLVFAAAVIVTLLASPALADDQTDIRKLTTEFCAAIVAKDLTVIDKVFDVEGANVYYDINEGPLTTVNRLKQVWRAATNNYTITKFEFMPDMKVEVKGSDALQTGKWTQTQVKKDGSTRDFVGRATILWKKTAGGWRVYHYHASITPTGR